MIKDVGHSAGLTDDERTPIHSFIVIVLNLSRLEQLTHSNKQSTSTCLELSPVPHSSFAALYCLSPEAPPVGGLQHCLSSCQNCNFKRWEYPPSVTSSVGVKLNLISSGLASADSIVYHCQQSCDSFISMMSE